MKPFSDFSSDGFRSLPSFALKKEEWCHVTDGRWIEEGRMGRGMGGLDADWCLSLMGRGLEI